MAGKTSREQLLDLLDRKAFDPVLNAAPGDYGEADRAALHDVQQTTRSTKERYHKNYTTAEDVRTNFRRDLSSDSAQKVQRRLHDLGLPTLGDIKDEFERTWDRLEGA